MVIIINNHHCENQRYSSNYIMVIICAAKNIAKVYRSTNIGLGYNNVTELSVRGAGAKSLAVNGYLLFYFRRLFGYSSL